MRPPIRPAELLPLLVGIQSAAGLRQRIERAHGRIAKIVEEIRVKRIATRSILRVHAATRGPAIPRQELGLWDLELLDVVGGDA